MCTCQDKICTIYRMPACLERRHDDMTRHTFSPHANEFLSRHQHQCYYLSRLVLLLLPAAAACSMKRLGHELVNQPLLHVILEVNTCVCMSKALRDAGPPHLGFPCLCAEHLTRYMYAAGARKMSSCLYCYYPTTRSHIRLPFRSMVVSQGLSGHENDVG